MTHCKYQAWLLINKIGCNGEVDTYTMLTLPKLLPNLAMLKWNVFSWYTDTHQIALRRWESPLYEVCSILLVTDTSLNR